MTNEHPSPSFYHVCFAVHDLNAAMHELTSLVGVTWATPTHDRLGDWPYSLVFSTEFPHIELVSSVAGSPWHAEQPRFHHLGWWSHCLSLTDRRWQEAGATPSFDGREHGRQFVYVDAPASGARLEGVNISQQPSFIDRWAPQAYVPPGLDCPP